MDINQLSLWVVTLTYPLVAFLFLVLSVALFARYYFVRRREWILACSFVCLFFAIGMGLSSLAISALPRYPRASVVPYSRLVLSASIVPLAFAVHGVSREVLDVLRAYGGWRAVFKQWLGSAGNLAKQ